MTTTINFDIPQNDDLESVQVILADIAKFYYLADLTASKSIVWASKVRRLSDRVHANLTSGERAILMSFHRSTQDVVQYLLAQRDIGRSTDNYPERYTFEEVQLLAKAYNHNHNNQRQEAT